MKKIAIYVEGWTEFFFVARLIEELRGFGKVHLELKTQYGGAFYYYGTRGVPADAAEVEVLLLNCCGASDEKVKSFILDRQELLISQGYSLAIGLQDLYPAPLAEWDNFEAGLNAGLANQPLKILMALEVMEVEAWFLNESKHFEKLDATLTAQRIAEATGFNPVSDPAETKVPHPSKLLERIYELVGLEYDKKQHEILRTVEKLDYEELFVTVRSMSKSLDLFFSHLEVAGVC